MPVPTAPVAATVAMANSANPMAMAETAMVMAMDVPAVRVAQCVTDDMSCNVGAVELMSWMGLRRGRNSRHEKDGGDSAQCARQACR